MSQWTRDELLFAVRNVSVWKKKEERAPHKPLLILYALGHFLNEGTAKIAFTKYYEPFKRLLEEFGPPRKTNHPEYPFWHLQSSGIWEIEPAKGWVVKTGGSSPTKAELERRNALGGLVPAVQELLVNDPTLAGDIVSLLLTNHFPDSIHEDILAAVRLDQVQTVKPKRDPSFRENVLRAYGYRCAVCGFDLRLDNVPLALDAAHIRWHQASGPSIPANGLALCGLHHKLFDRGAFSLADDLSVEVSARVNGSSGLIECLLNFHSHGIAQPNLRSAIPDPNFIQWHRREVFHPPVVDWADLPVPHGRA
jgi:putative restriction endonuclease